MEVGKIEWAMEVYHTIDGLMPPSDYPIRSDQMSMAFIRQHAKVVGLENLLIIAARMPYVR
jgi:hypothetical protein